MFIRVLVMRLRSQPDFPCLQVTSPACQSSFSSLITLFLPGAGLRSPPALGRWTTFDSLLHRKS